MYTFTLFAAVTLCVSFAVLQASFEDMRAAPLAIERAGAPLRHLAEDAMPTRITRRLDMIQEANEGLLDRELASADPLQAYLDRYLTPPAP